MNDLIRPALYDAYHAILPVASRLGAPTRQVDVVGPICETGDALPSSDLPPLEAGDLLAIWSAGAYGAVMSSTYNMPAAVPEVLVRGTHTPL